jgi:RNA polymerase sigma-70 factor (ECF subfamily)
MKQTRDDQYDQFVSLLGHCENRIRRFVRSLTVGVDEIDDIMQDVSLECWRKFSAFSPSSGESPHEEFIRWACVVARFKVLSRIRDASRERLVFREGLAERLADESAEWAATQSSRQATLHHCLDKLQQDDRRLLLSVHAPGDSVADIARQTGLEARRLYSRVNTLRGLLLKCVQARLASE